MGKRKKRPTPDVGMHVTWTVGDRQYLGEVVGHYFSREIYGTMLRVRHFNGEMAPEVPIWLVDVLERTYDA